MNAKSPRSLSCLAAWIACSIALLGCGGSPSDTTVQGKVTYDGKPVTSGLINFLAVGGRPLGGGLQTDGTFKFDLPAGEYRVRIDSPPPFPEDWREGQPLPKLGPRGAPEKYASYDSSGLTATVKSDGPQTIDFNLE